jgi:alkanesulfonate monooxygenase SsuD/methylene tetrahydromethanopterin reductase-like flavin-dependent oxidoreductase (luciferase family)
MQFSVFHIAMGKGRQSDRQVYDDFLSDITLAEQLGFDTFWLAEHHFNSNFSMSPSPNVLLAAAAVMTKRMKIGTAINVLPFHNPVRLAEEGAMLDLLSNGRFQWGIGRGITGHEFHGFGIDPSESLARFREIHDFVLNAWKTGEMKWDGQFIKVPAGIDLAPAITQRPHPPIWVTAQSPSSVEWAAERGYPAMQVAETLESSRVQLARYRAAAQRAGMKPDSRGEIVPSRYVYVADTEKQAREVGGKQITDWWHEFTAIAAPKPETALTKGYEYWQDAKTSFKKRTGGMSFEELIETGVIIVGTPHQVIRQIERQVDAFAAKHIMCDFWRAGKAREDRQHSMTLFGQKVIPYFNAGNVSAIEASA